jgi:hypothetical protein
MLVVPFALQAQPVLQQTMIAPGGTSYDLYTVVSAGSATVPTGGANQTWDLSSLVLLNAGTMDFVPAASTPYAANHPSANYAWEGTFTGLPPSYAYFSVTSSAFEVVADDVPDAPNIYTDPKKLLVFPMNYGQTFVDPYISGGGASSVSWTYAGYGTTVLPYGTFTNTVLLTSNEGDVLIWSTAPLHPLASYNGTDALLFGPGNVGIGDASTHVPLNAFPNPCNEVLNVDLPGDAGWRITDLQGRQVLAGRSSSAAQQALPVASLAPGAYVLLVDNAGATRGQRFVKH